MFGDGAGLLSDDFGGREVRLWAVALGRVDRLFARNFAQAKYMVSRGLLDRVTVLVSADDVSVRRTVDLVAQAVGGAPLPAGFVFEVASHSDGGQVGAVSAGIACLGPVGVVEPVSTPVGGGDTGEPVESVSEADVALVESTPVGVLELAASSQADVLARKGQRRSRKRQGQSGGQGQPGKGGSG